MNINRIQHIFSILKNTGLTSSCRLLSRELKRILVTPKEQKDFPKRIQIETSNVCNLDCVYCTLKKNMPVKGTMSPETFSKLIPYFKYFRAVSICGNTEGLINNNVSSFIRQIKSESKGVYISIFTNAELLTEQYCREFIQNGLDSLVFSIDGVDPEIVDPVRRKGSLKKVISNIEQLQKTKKDTGSKLPIVSATMVMYRKNYRQMPEVLRLLREMGVWRLNVNGLEPYSEDFLSEIIWNDPTMFEEVAGVISKSDKLSKELKMEFLVANLIPQNGHCDEIGNPIILANGDVVPCSVLSYPRPGLFSVSDENKLKKVKNNKKQVVFGNINEKGLDEIWFDPDYVDFRKRVQSEQFPEECEHCLVKHRFICVRSEWSVKSVLDKLHEASKTDAKLK